MDPVTLGLILAGSGAASSIIGKGMDKPGEVKKISTLNKEQEALMGKLSPYLEGRVGQGLRPWEGEFTAGMSPYEQAAMGKVGEFMGAGPSALETYGLGQYKEGLAGMSPEAAQEYYAKYYQPLRKTMWEQEVEPAISEAYVGPGLYFGTERGRGIERGAQEWGERGMQEMGGVLQAERARSASLMPYLPQMAGMGQERLKGQAEMGTTYGALPRLLEQQELSAQIQDYIRTDPQSSPILQYALQLLNTQTQTAFYQPESQSALSQIGPQLMGAGGMVMAAGSMPTPKA